MFLLPFAILIPLIACLFLTGLRKKLSFQQATVISLGGLLMAFFVALVAIFSYFIDYGVGSVIDITVPNWIRVGSSTSSFGLSFDGLSLMLTGIISLVGFLIQLFASWSLQHQKEYSRVFCYLNLLISALLIVVLADNLFLLYLGWEALGVVSYLLFCFYQNNISETETTNALSRYQEDYQQLRKREHQESNELGFSEKQSLFSQLDINTKSILKMLMITRLGSVMLAFGLIVLAYELGTLNIFQLIHQAPQSFTVNDSKLLLATASIAIGAIVQSAQLPWHTWLISNRLFTIPASISALLYSLTLLAGAYVIIRLHPLFVLTPNILLWWIGAMGAITTVVAGLCALVQTDLKRILGYASMSQMGFIFLAMGIGAWQLAVFHMMTFAFTQALLFLSAKAITDSVSQEQNILKMGGLKDNNPFVFYSFMVGMGSFVAFPFASLGYYSKVGILWEAYIINTMSSHVLFDLALLGVFLSALFSFRLVWHVFFAERKTPIHTLSGLAYQIPLAILLILSTCFGVLLSPKITGLLTNVLPNSAGQTMEMTGGAESQLMAIIMVILVIFSGFVLSWLLYVKYQAKLIHRFKQTPVGDAIHHWFHHGLGFDELYDWLLLKPLLYFIKLFNSSSLATRLKMDREIDSTRLQGYFIRGSIQPYCIGFFIGAMSLVTMILVLFFV